MMFVLAEEDTMEEKRTSKSQTKDDCQEESFLFVNSTFCVHFFSPDVRRE